MTNDVHVLYAMGEKRGTHVVIEDNEVAAPFVHALNEISFWQTIEVGSIAMTHQIHTGSEGH